MTLDDLRKDIDRVDEVLVRLLNERARCACEIGRLKKESNIAIYQPDREKQVLEQAYMIKIADVGVVNAHSKKVEGLKPFTLIRYWNVGLAK